MDALMSSSLGAVGPLLRKLELLLAPEYPLRRSLKQAIELLKEDLEEISATLMRRSMVDSPNNKAKYWMDEVRELSYDIEDVIDNMTRPRTRTTTSAKVRSVHCHRRRVRRLKVARLSERLKASTRISRIAELRTLLRESSERHERFQLDDCPSNPRSAFIRRSSSRVPVPAVNRSVAATTDLVGMEASRDELTKWLTNQEEQQLKVLSLIGPPGVGKSTLVRELYRQVKGQFECRICIRMPRKPDVRRLLGEMLSQVQGKSDVGTVQCSIDNIREHLQDKRYFIVIDNLWEAAAWDIIHNAFPKGNRCSRIILTSETQDIVAKCCDHHSISVFEMKPLGIHNSQKLFFSRVFGSEEHQCPDNLKEASCSIIRKCGGLPLATITITGLLASEPDDSDLWQHLQQYLLFNLENLTVEEISREIVNLCYHSLPQYLKTCLLYLNIYPEGCIIWKDDLLKQWIAEGFVSPTEGEERIAESYFDELVNRGMIQPEKINNTNEVLSCTIHHIVHDLITHKSSEEKFITAVDCSQTITGFDMEPRRLSLHFSCAQYATKPEGIRLSQVRSLAFLGLPRCMPSIMEFKLLRVLILEFWGDYDGCTSLNLSGVCILFLLRYLKISSHIFVELPSQIQGLQFLETLQIDARSSAVPIDIACLPGLVHLSLRHDTKLPYGIGRIKSLQTLEHFDLGNNSEDNVQSLGELINLKDLRLTCSTPPSEIHLKRNLVALSSSLGRLANLKSFTLAPGTVGMSHVTKFVDHSYAVLSTLTFLQRLELLSPICIFSVLPEWIAKLQKLRILKIMVRVLLRNDIDILAGMPVLTALSLFVRFRRPSLENVTIHSGAFPVLKYFNYRCSALCLTFNNGALYSLERLKLGFNVHRGDQYGHMIDGIENLVNLKVVTVQIGAAAGAMESDRRAAESAFRDAIHKHPWFQCFLNVKMVDRVEEESNPVDKQQRTRRVTHHVRKRPKLASVLPGRFQPILSQLTVLLGDEYNLLHEVRVEVEFRHHELASMEALLQRLGPMEKFVPNFEYWNSKLSFLFSDIQLYLKLLMKRLGSAEDKDGNIRDGAILLNLKIEEVEKVLTSYLYHFSGAQIEQSLPPTYKLCFVKELNYQIYTRRMIQAVDGSPIQITILSSNQQGSYSPQLLSARIKIVVLDGNFNADNREGWTSEEFCSHIVRPRDKVGALLKGQLELKLKNGVAYLHDAIFVDNSSFVRSRKFRLGVSLIDDLGERVQEGITEPFVVKDRRGEAYKKFEIPSLDDEVWRLKRISKGGVFHRALEGYGITTVKHFLRLYYRDEEALRKVLEKASQGVWRTIVGHATKCDSGRALYSYFIDDKDIRLYFSSLGQIVGATIASQYVAFEEVNCFQKTLLLQCCKVAYECMTYHQPDYEMHNGEPRPIDWSDFQGSSITSISKSTEHTDKIKHESDQQDSSKFNTFSDILSQPWPLPSAHEENDVSAVPRGHKRKISY